MPESSAGKKKAKVEFLLNVAQVSMALVLLGVLAGQGLLERDGFLSAYLGVAFLGGAMLYVLARMGWGEAPFLSSYLAVNTIAFYLAFTVVGRHVGSLGTALLAGACWIAVIVVAKTTAKNAPLAESFTGAIGMQFFILGVVALALANLEPLEFDRVKFGGLALFWMASGAAGVAYWSNPQSEAGARSLSTAAGTAGTMGCLFMAVFFSGMTLEPTGRVDLADTQQQAVEAVPVERKAVR